MPTQPDYVGTIELGTEQYGLVRVDEQQAWEMTISGDTGEDEESLIPIPMNSWHNGGFKSRPGIPDSSEYGKYTDCRFPGRILPAGKFQTLWSSTEAIPTWAQNAIFEAYGPNGTPYLWWVANSGTDAKVYRMSAGGTITLSLSISMLTSGQINCGIGFDGTPLVAFDDASASGGLLRKCTAIVAGGPDTWTANTARGFFLVRGVDRAFRISGDGILRNCLYGLDPTDEGNWADQIQVGAKTDIIPTGIVAYDRSVLVARTDGVFGIGPEGTALPIVPTEIGITNFPNNMWAIPGYVVFANNRGVYRWSPGNIESMGIEKELLNESPVRGRLRSLVSDGRFLWGALGPIGSDTDWWIVTFKEGKGSFGPYVIDTYYWNGNRNSPLFVTTITDPPKLLAGRESGMEYMNLGRGGGAPDPFAGGMTFFGQYGGGPELFRVSNKINLDWDLIELVKIDVVGRNLTTGATHRDWRIGYAMDGSSTFATLDINGAQMEINTNGKKTFYVPRTASAKEFQFRVQYLGNELQTIPGEILAVVPYFRRRKATSQHYTMTLRLATGQQLEGGTDRRSTLEQLNDLIALSKPSVSVDTKGPWGEFQCWVRKVNVVQTVQEGFALPEFIVQVSIQKREEAA